ncbi:hypothetical protein VB711_02750 [Cronbergia sp. UHCC 0137]|uniref:hypothetical protein n=1 Tax=Cronbergia sp. UHCC 0137 TaxID=3110239 RepID=UPI002B2134F0|nr:hypothetical protein [Cronbergia sp. UHCC 0137]MEA5616762.1 hypothetical protein [Cronbergia sp. UHCC 0137]
MSQNSPINSRHQSSKIPGLKPQLVVALASLEVQLDQELTRYRRTLHESKKPKSVSTESHVNQVSKSHTITTSFVQTPSPTELNYLQFSSASPSSSSIVPTKIQTPESEDILPSDNTSEAPDDYLESSEALRRSLQEEETQTKKLSNSSDSLLSPLGIGSMLLLLVASMTLGYIVFNPKSLPQLSLAQFFNSNSSPTVESDRQLTAVPVITPIPKYPNLAAREFPKVREPNDIVGLKPKVQRTPIVLPNPIPAQPIIPTPPPLASVLSVNPEPSPQPTQTPTQKPNQKPEITRPIDENTEIKPSADGYYYIVTDNQGNDSLAASRKVVRDAYLSPSKKYIYLGALKTKTDALRRVQQLQAQGIKAKIQTP